MKEKELSIEEYVPSKTENFMNDNQRDYFRHRLLKWKQSLIEEQKKKIISENSNEADVIDIASKETDQNINLATRRRENLLMSKINQALKRIDEGTYGYCEETGEPIDINRLIARPIATLSLEAQEKKEKMSKFRSKSRVY